MFHKQYFLEKYSLDNYTKPVIETLKALDFLNDYAIVSITNPPLAQMVEQLPFKEMVQGSSP